MLLVFENLEMKPQSYRVSSKILTIASAYFRSLLSPNFQEGIALRTHDQPQITLREDCRQSMDWILKLLHHHRGQELPIKLTPHQLALMAIQCDKYDLNNAMRMPSALWCSRICNGMPLIASVNEEDAGLVLMATMSFRSQFLNSAIQNAANLVRPRFAVRWKGHPMMQAMDPSWIRKCTSLCSSGLQKTNCCRTDTSTDEPDQTQICRQAAVYLGRTA